MTEAGHAPASREFSFAHQLRTLRLGWWVVILSVLLFAVGGLVYSLLQTPVYTSNARLYVTSDSGDNAQTVYQGSLASEQRVASYVELVTSDTVVSNALRASGLSLSVDEAKQQLKATTTLDTVLLTVSADSTDPGEAAALANSAALALTSYVASLEKPAGGGDPLVKLTVVTPAKAAVSPSTPRTYRNVLSLALAGLLVGVAAAFIRDRYDSKVRTDKDVAELSDAPVIGTIPTDSDLDSGAIDFGVGASLAAESYRQLRSNLSFINVDKPARVILVTSPNQGEGKTTTALNLAAGLAETGNRVVLVDADLRRPSVASRLGLNASIGLTDYLRGGVAVADLVQPSGRIRLDILSSGQLPPNPAELLGSERAGMGVQELRDSYDVVIIDSPPVLPVADASVMMRWSDGTVVVVRAGATSRVSVAATVDRLATAKATILGFVVNGLGSHGTSYKYAYYDGGSAVGPISTVGPSR